jgi:hypothetical protein
MAYEAAPGADERGGNQGAQRLSGHEECERDRPPVEHVAGEDREHLPAGKHEVTEHAAPKPVEGRARPTLSG